MKLRKCYLLRSKKNSLIRLHTTSTVFMVCWDRSLMPQVSEEERKSLQNACVSSTLKARFCYFLIFPDQNTHPLLLFQLSWPPAARFSRTMLIAAAPPWLVAPVLKVLLYHWQQQWTMLIFTFGMGLLLQPPLTSWSQRQCFSSQAGSCRTRQPNSQPLLLRGEDTTFHSILIVITASSLFNLITPVLCFFMPCAQCWSLPVCLVLPVVSSRLSSCLPDSDLAFVLPVFRGNFCQHFGNIWGTSCPWAVSLGRPLFIFCCCSTEREHLMAWSLHVGTQPELHLPPDCLWAKGWDSSHSKSFIQLPWWWR